MPRIILKDTKAIVIDLRDNGGWLLLAVAQEMLSHFFQTRYRGAAWSVKKEQWGKHSSHEDYSRKRSRQIIEILSMTDIPLVVLVNENSASASEIFAWAVQDLERGEVIGRKTYGKWSVQQPFELSDGSQIKITIARWFTPWNHSIDKLGINPDIILDPIPVDANLEKIISLLEQEKKKALDLAKKISQ
jgi:carboxyl-terminal processing protease